MICIAHQKRIEPRQKATGYHPGQVAPPTADGASLETIRGSRHMDAVPSPRTLKLKCPGCDNCSCNAGDLV